MPSLTDYLAMAAILAVLVPFGIVETRSYRRRDEAFWKIVREERDRLRARRPQGTPGDPQ
jgi:hypothetical protein